MKILVLIVRILLGVMFIAFGLNVFHPFIPMGPMPPADSPIGIWYGVMMVSGWMRVIAAVQIVGGLLVLSGRMLPLGLALLCPVTFNILCFHMLLSPRNIHLGLATAVFELVLIYYYRPYFRGLMTTKAEPVFSRTA